MKYLKSFEDLRNLPENWDWKLSFEDDVDFVYEHDDKNISVRKTKYKDDKYLLVITYNYFHKQTFISPQDFNLNEFLELVSKFKDAYDDKCFIETFDIKTFELSINKYEDLQKFIDKVEELKIEYNHLWTGTEMGLLDFKNK